MWSFDYFKYDKCTGLRIIRFLSIFYLCKYVITFVGSNNYLYVSFRILIDVKFHLIGTFGTKFFLYPNNFPKRTEKLPKN